MNNPMLIEIEHCKRRQSAKERRAAISGLIWLIIIIGTCIYCSLPGIRP
jgi:CHASE3 domain sensor protein